MHLVLRKRRRGHDNRPRGGMGRRHAIKEIESASVRKADVDEEKLDRQALRPFGCFVNAARPQEPAAWQRIEHSAFDQRARDWTVFEQEDDGVFGIHWSASA